MVATNVQNIVRYSSQGACVDAIAKVVMAGMRLMVTIGKWLRIIIAAIVVMLASLSAIAPQICSLISTVFVLFLLIYLLC